eukprot:TRINITY_DN15150_c0_g1_i1.p1 TRINITY_DN15150_c0_g1~~TRINITY_DN15150_c0_g1_i1.p1  ORF type:complete len:298 (+),score=89.84 TRINITY_DN15150_c0_g1_i1:75-896(+)
MPAQLLRCAALLGLAAAVSGQYKFFRLSITSLRDASTATAVQLSRVKFSAGGQEIDTTQGCTAIDPDGQCPETEGPANAVDGRTDTKWLDFQWQTGRLIVAFDVAKLPDKFTYTTADDSPERDPTGFTIEANPDGTDGKWVTMLQQTGYTPTDARETDQQWFDLVVPGAGTPVPGAGPGPGPGPAPGPGPSGGGGGSSDSGCGGGCIFLILFFVGGFTYFAAGFAYNYKMRDLRGTEAVPNSAFWKDLPFLIKDGVVFTANKIRGNGATYSAV